VPTLPSIHDNSIYAYAVECSEHRLTLHTLNELLNEFTDVIFHEVIAHWFEHVLEHNVLFDVDEVEITELVQEHATVFKESWRWGWPPLEYEGDLGKLTAMFQSQGLRAYRINASFGLSGWVLAGRCERFSRSERTT
jgi:hypothetical protein